jgi:DNA-binding transcriptional MerR regulator
MSAKDSERGLRSGELACLAGVSPDTLRHYERLGVLKEPPRTEAGYRLYPPDALSRVLLIRNALAVGFSLDELTRILRLRDSGQAPCREVAEMAQEKVSALDLQIEQLIHLRDSLKVMVKEWERRLKKTPAGNRAGLLESLPQRKDYGTTGTKRRMPRKLYRSYSR